MGFPWRASGCFPIAVSLLRGLSQVRMPFSVVPSCCSTPGCLVCAAVASCHCAGSTVGDGEGEVLQPHLTALGCTHRNSPDGKFFWLNMGLDTRGKLLVFLCSAFSLVAQAHKPLLFLCLPCNNFKSMDKGLADILAGLMSSVSKSCPWLVLLSGCKLRSQLWESNTSPGQKQPLGDQG